MWRLVLIALAAVTVPLAQQKTGSISGVVRDASTDAVLSGVHISADGHQAVTDSLGRFSIGDVAAGSQWVHAWASERGGSGGVYVAVSAGEQAAAEIRLKLGGSITGRVVDEDHRPVTGASVILLSRRYENGRLAYSPVKSAPTDKDGVYRLDAVYSETPYLLLVKKALKANPASEDERESVLAPSYYPNVRDVGAAQTVTLMPGEVRTGVDIRVNPAPGYCIAGAVDRVGAAQDLAVSITENLALGSGWSLSPATVKVGVEGRFAACGLHPGEYRLSASGEPPASANAIVTDRDLADLKLLGRPVPTIAGEVAFDPPPREKPGVIDLSLMTYTNFGGPGYVDSLEKGASFGLGGALSFGDQVQVPGAFDLGRVAPGEWQVRLGKLPAGCYLKAATYGAQDVRHAPLRPAESAGGERLRLVLGCDGGAVSAKVTDDNGNPVSHVVLYLVPAGVASEGELSVNMRRANVVNGWSAPLSDVPPGKYLALATELDVDTSADKVEKLWQARGSGQELTVAAAAMVQIELRPVEIE